MNRRTTIIGCCFGLAIASAGYFYFPQNTTYPNFEFRGLIAGRTSLEEAIERNVVTRCAPMTTSPGGVMCEFSSDKVADIPTERELVSFSNGVFEGFIVDFSSSQFNAGVTSLSEAYGQPCQSQITKLQNAYGAMFKGDKLKWCFAKGVLTFERHKLDDLMKAELIYGPYDDIKVQKPRTSNNL